MENNSPEFFRAALEHLCRRVAVLEERPYVGEPPAACPQAADALLAKLPRYADTGEPFIPGYHSAWVISPRRLQPEHVWTAEYTMGHWRFYYGSWGTYTDDGRPYSSYQAADIASRKGEA